MPTLFDRKVSFANEAITFPDKNPRYGSLDLQKGTIVQSAPRSVGKFQSPFLAHLTDFCEARNIDHLRSDVLIDAHGRVIQDQEVLPHAVGTPWTIQADLPGKFDVAFDLLNFQLSEKLRRYGAHIPGLARFGWNGICHRLSTELRHFPAGHEPDSYDRVLHIDAVSESLTTPVAQMIWSNSDPTLVVERSYEWQGTEREPNAVMDWAADESQEYAGTLPRLVVEPEELIIARAATFLHLAQEQFETDRWLLRTFAEPITLPQLLRFSRPHIAFEGSRLSGYPLGF